jgi:hypothetical protein
MHGIVREAQKAPALSHRRSSKSLFLALQVQDEIFCSANIILPDKAGRILNIGGWSDAALFGIRLFTPGGAGENINWQEDETTVELQVRSSPPTSFRPLTPPCFQRPRWYPTAMILANGSVLIMGGEDTNSGNEQPNLEVLPRAPGGDTTVYLQFLADTYPFNLYPFLVVLPSKNVLTSKYNVPFPPPFLHHNPTC